MAVKVRNLVGFTDNPNNVMRVGSYRNSSPTLSENTAEITVGLNPSTTVANLAGDGVDVEPYVEQISAGTSFELTNMEVSVTMTESRRVSST